MKQRDLIKKLIDAGFKKVRSERHFTYFKEGVGIVEVPNHREVNELTAKKILKDAGL